MQMSISPLLQLMFSLTSKLQCCGQGRSQEVSRQILQLATLTANTIVGDLEISSLPPLTHISARSAQLSLGANLELLGVPIDVILV